MKYILKLGDFHRTGKLIANPGWLNRWYHEGIYTARDCIAFYSDENNYFGWFSAYERWLHPVLE